MKKNKFYIFVSLICVVFCLVFGYGALAFDTDSTGLTNTANSAGFDTQAPPNLAALIGNIIQAVLAIIGVVLLIIIIYGGFLYMTSGGSPDQATKGKNWIINGIIGVIIIVLAYAISSYVIDLIAGAMEGNRSLR